MVYWIDFNVHSHEDVVLCKVVSVDIERSFVAASNKVGHEAVFDSPPEEPVKCEVAD